MRRGQFSQRVTVCWNSLLDWMKMSATVDNFKNNHWYHGMGDCSQTSQADLGGTVEWEIQMM